LKRTQFDIIIIIIIIIHLLRQLVASYIEKAQCFKYNTDT